MSTNELPEHVRANRSAWRLLRPQFGMGRTTWPGGDGSVEFNMGHGRWIETFRGSGFEIEELIEYRPPAGATTPFQWMSGEWARQWPAEDVWKVRKRI